MTAPLVSVLMPVYNCGPFVDEAIECILRQTFTDFEFLIVDDASTDDTWARLQKHTDSRIVLSRNAANKGLAQNLNELLAIARGEFIARMDGDDACLPERFALQVGYLRDHPDCGAVGSHYVWMDSDGRDTRAFFMPLEDSAIRAGLPLHCNTIIHATVMFRRAPLAAVGGYRPRISIAEDYDLLLRLLPVCAFGNVPRLLYRYRQHAGQVGTARRREQGAAALMTRLYAVERDVRRADSLDLYTDEDLAAMRKGAFLFPRAGTVPQRKLVMRRLVALLVRAMMPREAARVAAAAIRRWPLWWGGYASLAGIYLTPRTYLRSYRIAVNGLRAAVRRSIEGRPAGGAT